jgi:hypothetical protein
MLKQAEMPRQVDWTQFKSYAIANSMPLRGFEDTDSHYIYASDAGFTVFTILDKNPTDTTDLDDYVNNYKATINTRIGQFDTNGVALSKQKVTRTGWHYCPTFIEITTAKYPSLHFKLSDNITDIADAKVSYFNGSTELKRVDYESDETFQAALTISCNKTILDWQSTYDFDPRAAAFIMGTKPPTPAYMYVVVAPDIPANLGGSVPFNIGGVPLHLFADNSISGWDALTVKSVVADPIHNSNKFRLIFFHDAGVQINCCFAIQLYRA